MTAAAVAAAASPPRQDWLQRATTTTTSLDGGNQPNSLLLWLAKRRQRQPYHHSSCWYSSSRQFTESLLCLVWYPTNLTATATTTHSNNNNNTTPETTETMAVSMENPQDPEHGVQFRSPLIDDEDGAKHASKYPKKRQFRRTALSLLYNRRILRFKSSSNHKNNNNHHVSQMTALVFSIVLTVLVVHRLFSLYMSHRRWINAPITYLPRSCPAPNYATLSLSSSSLSHGAVQQQEQQEAGKICVTTLTDARNYSPLQRFLRWRNFDGILELTWHNKLSYSNKHGYTFYDGSDWIDTSRPPAWSKIKAVQHLLLRDDGCDWVMWTDADTVIMNSEAKIEDFLPADPTKDLLVGSDKGGGYNSGVFVIRKSAWSEQFLQQWWDMESYVNPPGLSLSGDNHALKALLRDMVDFDAHVLSPARCTFNSFAKFLTLSESGSVMDTLDQQPWYLSDEYYHKGDFLAHAPGYDNKENCLRLLLQEAR